MIVLGITGPTGAGKTTALEVLAELGFEIVDCDALYYQLLRTDEALRRSLEEAFGTVFLPDGSLDRRAVAKRVFGDPAELARRYAREWRRRTLWPRWLAAAELTLFAACVAVVSLLYIANARNFGKPHKKDLLLMPSIW